MTAAPAARDATDEAYTADFEGPRSRGRFLVYAPSQAEAELAALAALRPDETLVQVAAA